MATGVLERRTAEQQLTSASGKVTAPTIFALSSGRPPAGIAVVRISGPAAFLALERLSTRPLPAARVMSLRTLSDPDSRRPIDRAMVVRFTAPASATGEDMVELHLHGGTAVVAAAVAALRRTPGLRLAAAGEFTRQAFDNGKLDLSQVEGIADLIDADTEEQRVQAIEQSGGRLRDQVGAWRSTLIDLLADIEAQLDFADEDVALHQGSAQAERLTDLRSELASAIADARRGERRRDGLTVAVVGPPNAGKSSLVNALARREVAIVATTAGTTRDVIEVRLDLDGIAVTVLDTAGVRHSDDPVELEGIRRGRARAEQADLVLAIGSSASIERVQAVVSKVDLSGDHLGFRDDILYVSAVETDGIAPLEAWLADWARTQVRAGEPALVTQERHRLALIAGHNALVACEHEADPIIVAECLRAAIRALAAITGEVGIDDILDAVFKRFCIGK